MTAKLLLSSKTNSPLLSSDNAVASVERSGEFLSCAKTALKIGKNQHKNDPNPPPPNAWWTVSPSDLRLLDATPQNTRAKEVLQDGLDLLRTMEEELKQLESLVRRRGQTNDPTQAIAASTRRLEQDTQELTAWLPTIIPPTVRRNTQAYKHYTMIQEWFQQSANEQGKRLQEIMKVRGKVLADQARRRKHFQATSESRPGSTLKPVSNVNNNNPLFQLAPPQAAAAKAPSVKPQSANGTTQQPYSNGHAQQQQQQQQQQQSSYGNGSSATASSFAASAPSSSSSAAAPKMVNQKPYSRPAVAGGYTYYPAKPGGGYGSASPYAASTTGGYGGSGGGGGGMRQRKAATSAATTDSTVERQQQEQTLMLQRQQERQTQMRLREARETEKGLASLVGLFGKMSTLISEQSEVIDKIEDDVEAAALDVQAGQDSISHVYSLKKGNRPLIIRVFAILIFVIIFMRFYRG